MRKRRSIAIVIAAHVLTCVADAAQTQGRRGRRRGSRGAQGAKRDEAKRDAAPAFLFDVPKHTVDIVLGRPTESSVTASVLVYADAEGYLTYGTAPGMHTGRSGHTRFSQGEPVTTIIDSLRPNTRYYYQFHYRVVGDDELRSTAEYCFHTQRPPGGAFTFTVQADSHLDEHTSIAIYEQTLANALADKPDFHVDLGDTFMTEKIRKLDLGNPAGLYPAQRYYFGLLCHSAPLFLVLGNHDGEASHNSTAATILRKRYYPNPFPDGFYTGNETEEEGIGLPENYYAWHWGDALFVVLDPFRYGRPRGRKEHDNWGRTLGEKQYRWLKTTLADSKAAFKFVFVHHLVGGLDRYGRGGSEAAKLYEWGGLGEDGRDDFSHQRPGWGSPIHDLLVHHNVSVVFHGHDHFFAKQDLDGIVYQLVPQPGHPGSARAPRQAADYGYISGDFLGGSGHMRVRVSKEEAVVEFVRSCLLGNTRAKQKNGQVAHTYTIGASRRASRGQD